MQKLVAQVLAAWREAERVVAEHAPGTPEHEAAMVAEARLRDMYGELTAALHAPEQDESKEATSMALPPLFGDTQR